MVAVAFILIFYMRYCILFCIFFSLFYFILLIYLFIYFFAVFRKKVNIYLGRILYWNILSSFMSNIWYCKCLLQITGDIELNTSPKPNSCKSFSICHWNLNSITSQNFIKASLLTAYNSIRIFDIICLTPKFRNTFK